MSRVQEAVASTTRRMKADEAGIVEAARVLQAGGLAAFPTETVYGLGADATDDRVVAKLFEAKGRPSFNPLIAHVRDISAARRAGKFNELSEKLAARFWPGPLTLVVPANNVVCDLARAGLQTVALRVPKHPVAQSLLTAFGKPIAAPSANRSGHVSPTSADHVSTDLSGRIDFILDGGTTPMGLESTIIDCTSESPRLFRLGGIARHEIETFLGISLVDAPNSDAHAPTAPGRLASHYATRAKLRLNATDVRPNESFLAFGPKQPKNLELAVSSLNLSPRGELVEAAANLFAYLRSLDASGAATIAISPIPHEGLGEAINDRLKRAAAPR